MSAFLALKMRWCLGVRFAFAGQETLTQEEFKLWKASKHRPLTIATAMSSCIRRSGVSDMIALEMEQQVSRV